MPFYIDKSKRHFRDRSTLVKEKNILKKKKHPHYIIGEDDTHFLSLGITHDKKKGKGHNNHLLTKNPNEYDSEPSYIKKQIERSHKNAFSKYILNYSLSEIDEFYVDNLISKNKKYRN